MRLQPWERQALRNETQEVRRTTDVMESASNTIDHLVHQRDLHRAKCEELTTKLAEARTELRTVRQAGIAALGLAQEIGDRATWSAEQKEIYAWSSKVLSGGGQ